MFYCLKLRLLELKNLRKDVNLYIELKKVHVVYSFSMWFTVRYVVCGHGGWVPHQ